MSAASAAEVAAGERLGASLGVHGHAGPLAPIARDVRRCIVPQSAPDKQGGMDALLSPIRVNPPEAAGLYPARSLVGYALFRKRTAVLATSRERAADMYRSATVQNGTQWNIDGEELREKQLPHLASSHA